jgi:hypothetical protein
MYNILMSNNFLCKSCPYKTASRYNWKKHLLTIKHISKTNHKEKIFKCDICNKFYKHSSGLSRHKQICSNKNIIIKEKCDLTQNSLKITSTMFYEVLEQNNKLQEQLIEMSKKPNIVNVDNKKMTINIFLNEMCKDAMNLSDFINNVNVSLDDLTYTTDNGFIKGISNIFVKNLKQMQPTERPFHCSDTKRLQFYVKDEDKWGKDKHHIEDSIDKITLKQANQIHEWVNKYPNFLNSEKEREMCLYMIREVMGGGKDEEEKQRNKESIIRNISTNTNIKSAMISD